MAYDPYRPNIPSQGILSVRDLYNFYSNNPTIRGEEETVTPTPTPISVDPIVPNRFSYFNDDDEDYFDFNPDITRGSKGVASTNQTIGGLIGKSYRNLIPSPYARAAINLALGPMGTLLGVITEANNYLNPPTPQSVFQFNDNVADARSETYSTNPGIGFSNVDLEDYDPNLGNLNNQEVDYTTVDQTLGGETDLGLGLSDDEIASFDEGLRSEQAQQSQAEAQQAQAPDSVQGTGSNVGTSTASGGGSEVGPGDDDYDDYDSGEYE